MTILQRLANWSSSVDDDWPALAKGRAVDAIVDTIACMVAGAGDEGAAGVRRGVASWHSGGATVFGATTGAAIPFAALANGMAAHALDFDDNFLPGSTHASAVLVPALLALAETSGRRGPS